MPKTTRAEKLQNLEAKSSALLSHASDFQRSATELRRRYENNNITENENVEILPKPEIEKPIVVNKPENPVKPKKHFWESWCCFNQKPEVDVPLMPQTLPNFKK